MAVLGLEEIDGGRSEVHVGHAVKTLGGVIVEGSYWCAVHGET